MITYTQVKLIAEVIAFISVTGGVYLVVSIRGILDELLTERDSRWILTGAAVFWLGYLFNVLNDVIPTEFMKVADDVLVAVGMAVIFVVSIRIGRKLKLRVKPQVVLNGSPELKTGAYLVYSLPLPTLLKLLSGKKILAVTRSPTRWERLGIPFIWMTNVDHPRAVPPTHLAPLLHFAIRDADEDTFVIIDSLDYMVLQNGEGATLKFLLGLKDHLLNKNAGMVLVVDPATVNPPTLRVLEREFETLKAKP